MTGQTVGQAVAKQDNTESKPSAMIRTYSDSFTAVMPSHLRGDSWIRLAQSALRQNDKLAEAAQASPNTLMRSLLDCARLGLDPGTEEYYLTPRYTKNGPEVVGIPGYQGLIELMYRSGAVSSVTIETVREHDQFHWSPGRMERPDHEADWLAPTAERGSLRGVYAYAVMKDGATSKVVVLNRDHIAKAKESAQGAHTSYSPWQTNEEAMWLKTAARRLAKWVPTSTEDRRIVAATSERADQAATVEPDPLDITHTHTEAPGDPIEGELVDEEAGQ